MYVGDPSVGACRGASPSQQLLEENSCPPQEGLASAPARPSPTHLGQQGT